MDVGGEQRATRVGDLVLTAGSVAEMAGGRLVSGEPGQEIAEFSTDSRHLPPGALFIALRGERFDAHAFAGSAIASGACGAMVDTASAVPVRSGARDVVIVVDDTLVGLQSLARGIRRAAGTRVVAVTGSAGKTTTKEMAASLLAARYRTYRSTGNLNNHVGLPLSLLALRHRPEVAVVEIGMNHAGEIRTLVGIAEPDVRVWTNVAPVHLAYFASIEAIADAKAEILEGATPNDVLVANADDALVMARSRRFPGRLLRFGLCAPRAEVRAVDLRPLGLDGTALRLVTWKGEIDLLVPLPGRGQVVNALAAVSTALGLGVPLDAVPQAFDRLAFSSQRGQVLRLAGGVTLVDDSYNSNPSALGQLLEAVALETRCGRKVAVLGEMLELGESSVALHQSSGRAVAGAGVEVLITVGGESARQLGVSAIAAGVPADHVWHEGTSEEAAARAATTVRPGDLVLVKGSRGIGTERVVERLKAAFA